MQPVTGPRGLDQTITCMKSGNILTNNYGVPEQNAAFDGMNNLGITAPTVGYHGIGPLGQVIPKV